MPAQLTVATYNVHQWVGMDKFYDPGRGLSVLQEMHADIIGLQEVNFPKRIRHRITESQLARELGMELILGKTLVREQAAYGNVLLTALPVKEIRRHDISVSSREPRGVLDVDLSVVLGGRMETIRVLNTHFGLSCSERHHQHRHLFEILEKGSSSALTILMGDFNEWIPLRFPFRRIMRLFKKISAPRSFPTFWPVLALDRILVAPHQHLIEMHVHKSRLARVASDHYPVVASMRLN
ncbi:endonuclease/exonuclease/phosphatase family protein [Desulfonatronum thioautotrophicum]|uniref:endonuclease/exonuclease/phosphatase family protein n=1 Tax=Desulfonatronum thioautotrophicum TaxID=617001 RepID=UPI0005EB3EC6|nr:endonuclease/exonuclease/phosphatase family protein [Desulfonatronum thioautotrophicum]